MENKIGFFVKEKREKMGISQRELARMIFVDNKTINKIERGITEKIDFETLSKLAKIFNISIYEIGKIANYDKEEIEKKIMEKITFPINYYYDTIVNYNLNEEDIEKYTIITEEELKCIDIEKVLKGYKEGKLTIQETIILINASKPLEFKENTLIYPTENGNIEIEY